MTGIGPLGGDRWRARRACAGGIALGVAVAAVVLGSGAPTGASPTRRGPSSGAAGTAAPHRSAKVHAPTAGAPLGGAGEVASSPFSAGPSLPPSNPPANLAPVPAYTFGAGATSASPAAPACWRLAGSRWVPDPSAPDCVRDEVAATDHARADERLGPIRLPSDYRSLTPEEQLLVLTDIERVSRHEEPVVGLSPLVDRDAQRGADSRTDPRFDFGAIPSSDWWGSNVVNGALNALDANYTWMYEDGYGGDNLDCTSPSASGCWGHRDNVLASTRAGTLVMGAGDAAQPSGLQCMSELFVAVEDPHDLPLLSYTWAEAVKDGAAG